MKKVNRWHLEPVNDLRPHNTKGKACICRPKIEFVNGGEIIIHNSFDHREYKEQKRKFYKN